MHTFDKLYIDGAWVASDSTETIDVIDSVTEEVFGRIPSGTAADVDRAVAAAKAAFETWSITEPVKRADYLLRISAALEARLDEVSAIISRETGMPKPQSDRAQVGSPVNNFKIAAATATEFEWDEPAGRSLIVREPIGVVGCITPWNYPLGQTVTKVAYALAAGCTVVLKASEIAPLDTFILAEVMHEVGLPAGVFNLVSGYGPIVGEALAAHPDVDMISFTGSTRAGKRVAQVGIETNVKRVALELGGKSPNVLLDDLDDAAFERAVTEGVAKAYPNSGQTCSALTRMLVPRRRLAEAERFAAAAAEATVVGDPFAPGVHLGPLASRAQRDKVQEYIKIGIEEGARLIAGGPGAPEGLDVGFYCRPTVFTDVTNDMRIAREEIFGPVLVIIPFDDENDAVRIANDTPYGLAAGVSAGTYEHAEQVARRIRAGKVEINGAPPNPGTPFGGYKQSGIGREHGRWGLEEFLEIKNLQRHAP